MNIETQVRALAKSQYWLSLYQTSKECDGVQLFDNTTNFSGLQMLFIYWVKIYSLLYDEMHNQEWKNLSEGVILDDTHCDAFLYWRYKELEKRIRQNKEEERKTRNAHGKTHDEEKAFGIYRGTKK